MIISVIESAYPLDFRKNEAASLGKRLRHHDSVNIVGMKRVGISNFLRFFLSHKDVVPSYISKNEKHLFIPVDLNDLVERELFPFWTLTLKRIVDAAEKTDISSTDKKHIETLFLKTIQSQDLFLAIDSVRQALVKLIELGILPTLFLLRFDRIKDVITPDFFNNLQGLRDATNRQLAYVFTSYRSLDEMCPEVFTKTSLSVFSRTMFMGLAKPEDVKIIFKTYNKKYELQMPENIERELLSVVNGYVQYFQLSLIILHERTDALPQTPAELFSLLIQDERVTLQSEELWDSLSEKEREVLLKIVRRETVDEQEREIATYLWDTQFVVEEDGGYRVFSPLFRAYLEQFIANVQAQSQSVHFSKKEHELFSLLEQHINEICEREEIIQAVWPEYSEVGVSDWAIDRLVARVRTKLRQQGSEYEIKTIRTRGYQLVNKAS